MKLSLPPLLLLLTLLNTSAAAAPGHGAAAEATSLSAPSASMVSPHAEHELAAAPVEQLAVDGRTLSRQLAKLTGVAMSPLLGMGLLGASAYLQAPAEARAGQPWHLQPWAWGTALLLVLCVALEDTLLSVPGLSVLKKPLDAVKVVENKVSGAVAIPVVTKSAAAALALPLAGAVAATAQLALPTAHAAGPADAALGGAATAAVYVVGLVLTAGAFALVWLEPCRQRARPAQPLRPAGNGPQGSATLPLWGCWCARRTSRGRGGWRAGASGCWISGG